MTLAAPRQEALQAAALNGHRQRRPLLREDHRQQPRRLRLTRVFRDLVRRTGLFVKHLSGRVRFFLALSRNLEPNRIVSGFTST